MPRDEITLNIFLIICNKISDIWGKVANFSKKLGEFSERTRGAKEEINEDYNETV